MNETTATHRRPGAGPPRPHHPDHRDQRARRRRLDDALVASIAERGVLTPVVAHRRADGTVAVIYGQRRTLGAVQAGRATIPVHIVASPAEADRLVDQMAENDHRAALTTGERVAGFAQLAVLGLSAGQIAKRTATKPDQVAAALSTATSTLAAAVVERFDFLTLDQGAVLAEFDDEPETVKALVASASTGQFDHVAQRARDAREGRRRYYEAGADLRAAGVEVIEPPRPRRAGQEAGAADPRRQDRGRGRARACPGHAAFLDYRIEWHHLAVEDDLDDLDEDEQDYDEQEEPGRPGPRRGRRGRAGRARRAAGQGVHHHLRLPPAAEVRPHPADLRHPRHHAHPRGGQE